MIFNLVSDGVNQFITVYAPGSDPLSASQDHPNFDEIVRLARAGDDSVVDLFDVSQSVAQYFDRVSTRVSVSNGQVYFDGDPVDNSLTRNILAFMDEGLEDDFMALVNFFENVASNPNAHSREQLYRWLEHHDFPITPEGHIVAYKGVRKTNDGYTSISRGTAIVDGVVHHGAIPNYEGAVVDMPRSQVAHDPNVACHTGLHAGTWEYANGFAQGATLEVHINPRDVVSVPHDSSSQKVRVCRYKVVKVLDQPYSSAYVGPEDYDEDDDFEDDDDFDNVDPYSLSYPW